MSKKKQVNKNEEILNEMEKHCVDMDYHQNALSSMVNDLDMSSLTEEQKDRWEEIEINYLY